MRSGFALILLFERVCSFRRAGAGRRRPSQPVWLGSWPPAVSASTTAPVPRPPQPTSAICKLWLTPAWPKTRGTVRAERAVAAPAYLDELAAVGLMLLWIHGRFPLCWFLFPDGFNRNGLVLVGLNEILVSSKS